jgi:hypothetical protein
VSVSATRKATHACSSLFDIAAADGIGVGCSPSCLLVGARSADLDIRHAVPQRETATRQRHEVVAKNAVVDESLRVRAAVGTEGRDAPAFDVGNVNSHELAQFRDAARLEHDPEKACPGLDPGWIPVFGKDHAPTRS